MEKKAKMSEKNKNQEERWTLSDLKNDEILHKPNTKNRSQTQPAPTNNNNNNNTNKPNKKYLEDLKKGNRSVNLSYMGSSLFPLDILDFPQLVEIDLSYNKLTCLPPSFTVLTTLTTLNVCYNSLSTLPPLLATLPQLTSLLVSNNRLSSLTSVSRSLDDSSSSSSSASRFFPVLESLDLSENLFENFPEELLSFPSLKTLILHTNRIDSIPDEISLLTGLKTLNLSCNSVHVIPPSFSSLTNLTTLHIRTNPIERFPSEFAKLRFSLRHFHPPLSALADANKGSKASLLLACGVQSLLLICAEWFLRLEDRDPIQFQRQIDLLPGELVQLLCSDWRRCTGCDRPFFGTPGPMGTIPIEVSGKKVKLLAQFCSNRCYLSLFDTIEEWE